MSTPFEDVSEDRPERLSRDELLRSLQDKLRAIREQGRREGESGGPVILSHREAGAVVEILTLQKIFDGHTEVLTRRVQEQDALLELILETGDVVKGVTGYIASRAERE